MPHGTLAGRFINLCRRRLETGDARQVILNETDVNELQELVSLGNRFHHNTYPDYEPPDIDDTELQKFVRRTIAFTRRQK